MDNKLTDSIRPCPFCGNMPKVDKQPAGTRQNFHTAWVFISCNMCSARPHVGESRMVSEWVGNDVPNKRYCTNEEGLQSAYEWALKEWNKRVD